MSITRRSLAETYSEHDLIIQAAQEAKREATQSYRQQLDGLGMDKDAIKAEVEAFKLAYRRKVAVEKKGSDEVEHRDAIADEIFLEITAPHAPRATRVEIIEQFDPETGEITEPQVAPQPVQTVAANASVVASQVESGAVAISTPIQPETANTVPSIEGVKAPMTVADDANVGGDHEAVVDTLISTEAAAREASGMENDCAVMTRADASGLALGSDVETVAPSNLTTLVQKPLRPYCQNPGNSCGGMGKKHCWKCEKARDEAQGAA